MLKEREKALLDIVIKEYILKGKPIGSKYILKKYRIGCSPATVRIILHSLEEKGYLDRLSSSSGRIPTDKGYKFYIKDILRETNARSSEKIFEIFSINNVVEIVKKLTEFISEISGTSGFGFLIEEGIPEIMDVKVYYINENEILFVVVDKNGSVYTKKNLLNFDIKEKDVKFFNLFIKDYIIGRKKGPEEGKEKELFSIYKKFISSIRSPKIFLHRSSSLLRRKEQGVWNLYDFLENKENLNKLLSKLNRDGFFVFIGEETPVLKASNISLIGFSSHLGKRLRTVIGSIGFKRMEYEVVVSYLKEILKRFRDMEVLNGEGGKKRGRKGV